MSSDVAGIDNDARQGATGKGLGCRLEMGAVRCMVA
jgi:hypothetical protein